MCFLTITDLIQGKVSLNNDNPCLQKVHSAIWCTLSEIYWKTWRAISKIREENSFKSILNSNFCNCVLFLINNSPVIFQDYL